jgi:RHS repeat-associated protein
VGSAGTNDSTGSLSLYNYRARSYSPTLGRFLTEDPIGLSGGDVNLYAYVRNNPVTSSDPLGLILSGLGAAIQSALAFLGSVIQSGWDLFWEYRWQVINIGAAALCTVVAFTTCAIAVGIVFLGKELEIIRGADSFGDFLRDTAFNAATKLPFLIPGAAVWKGGQVALAQGVRLAGWQTALVRGTAAAPSVVCGFSEGCSSPHWPSRYEDSLRMRKVFRSKEDAVVIALFGGIGSAVMIAEAITI